MHAPDKTRSGSTRRLALLSASCACLLLSACSFSSTARNWNGTYGPDGKRVFVKSLTRIGANALILFPFVGWCTTSSLIDEITYDIRQEGGDRIRLVEAESTRFWIVLPPISFFITPIAATVTVEYQPSPEELERQEEREREAWFRETIEYDERDES